MSQFSGAFTVELPVGRIGREVAVEVVRLLDEAGLVPALAEAVVRELTEPSSPGGYPIGRQRTAGDRDYIRTDPSAEAAAGAAAPVDPDGDDWAGTVEAVRRQGWRGDAGRVSARAALLLLAIALAVAAGVAMVPLLGSGDREQRSESVAVRSVDGGEFWSVAELRDAVESAGVACDRFQLVDNPVNAIELAECTDQVNLAVHRDRSQAWQQVRAVNTLLGELDLGGQSHWVVGRNWTVNCSGNAWACRQIHDQLGGQLVAQQIPGGGR